MTHSSHRRRIRIVWEPETGDPWIVQYDQPGYHHHWTDAFRFDSYMRATSYVKEISERDRILLEAER
jgi:hypothetical protein